MIYPPPLHFTMSKYSSLSPYFPSCLQQNGSKKDSFLESYAPLLAPIYFSHIRMLL